MRTLTPTFEDDAKALEQHMLTIDPEAQISPEFLDKFAEDSGLDGQFLAGAFSMALSHERNCVIAFRCLEGTTANTMLKTKYKQFEKETVAAVEAYETAIEAMGGDVMYVSPAARLQEAIDSKLIESLLLTGAADPMTVDAKTVAIAGLGAMGCVMNVQTIQSFCDESNDGPSKNAMQALIKAVGPAGEKHHEWAMETHVKLATTSAKHRTTAKIMNKAEEVMDKASKKANQPD